MSVESRIQTSEIGVEYVELVEAEYDHYRGSGDAVVYFDDNATITAIDYIHNVPENSAKDLTDKALRHGNAWLGMCSTYTVCDLRKLDANYLTGFARIIRLVAENWNWD